MAGEGVRLLEDLVQQLTRVFNRHPARVKEPETDTSQEARAPFVGSATQSDGKSAYDWYNDEAALEKSRAGKYAEYSRMDIEGIEISSALDIYADNATSGEQDTNESIVIVSEYEVVKKVLNETKTRLNLDFELWSIARELVKNGDCFEEVVAFPDGEIHRLKHLPPDEVRVVADKFGRLDPEYPYTQVDDMGEVEAKFAEWQMLHFKMTKDRESLYGVDGSLLHSIRRVFKQLSMMEDAIVIARLTRAQQRFAFMIDVNGIEPGEQTLKYLTEVKNKMKKKRTIDPVTGQMDTKYNPLSVEEDIFLSSREGASSSVQVLEGAANLGELGDIEYFSRKLFAGLKVPKAWMGFEGETHARAVITELDVQFAKTVRRVQQALIAQLRKLFDLVLLSRGLDPVAYEYTVKLPMLSTVDELREWELEKIKAEVAKMYKSDLGVSTEWVYRHLLEFSDADIAEIRGSIDDVDSIDNARFAQELARADAASTTVVTGDEAPAQAQATAVSQGVPAVEGVAPSPRELRLLRHKLREDLESLEELTAWQLEHETGKVLATAGRR